MCGWKNLSSVVYSLAAPAKNDCSPGLGAGMLPREVSWALRAAISARRHAVVEHARRSKVVVGPRPDRSRSISQSAAPARSRRMAGKDFVDRQLLGKLAHENELGLVQDARAVADPPLYKNKFNPTEPPKHTPHSSSSRPLLRAFFTLAPPAAPPPAAVALPVKVAFCPDVTEDAENMRSASRKRLMRRIAPDDACLPR